MKTFIFTVAFAATSILAVGEPQPQAIANNGKAQYSTLNYFTNGQIDKVVQYYLDVKNALAADNAQEAAKAGVQLKTALSDLRKGKMNDAQKKTYEANAAGAIKNSEQIAKGGGNIKQQREQFESLSEAIYNMVKVFGASQTLYKDYCPMKKASWLSEVKDIKNPYYGSMMLKCGMIKETFAKQ